jgi:hypothetical protein
MTILEHTSAAPRHRRGRAERPERIVVNGETLVRNDIKAQELGATERTITVATSSKVTTEMEPTKVITDPRSERAADNPIWKAWGTCSIAASRCDLFETPGRIAETDNWRRWLRVSP